MKNNDSEKPAASIGLRVQCLVSLRSFFWWLFIYHGWPVRFIRSASYDLLDAAKEGAIACWHLLRIPAQPLVMAVAYVMDAGIREQLRAGHARNAKRNDPLRVKGTLL